MDNKVYIMIEKEIYNVALNRLMNADMPHVTFRKDDQLAMANEAIEKLRAAMQETAILLQGGNKDVTKYI